MDVIELRKMLRQKAPLVYKDFILKHPDKMIPNETPDDFIKDLENYQKKLEVEATTRKEEMTWKKV